MATKATPKEKFDRTYYLWNPNQYTGPKTAVLDTVLKPKPKENN